MAESNNHWLKVIAGSVSVDPLRVDDTGLPKGQAWWTVKRQCMAADACDSVALYVGNSQGELWMGRDEGRRWSCIARHLPEIYAVETAALG